MRREGVLFHLFCSNANVNDEGRECLNLDVPRFGEGRTGVGVGSRSGSGRKVEYHGWILRIKQGCAGG